MRISWVVAFITMVQTLVSGVPLTDNDLESEVSKGTWFIKYYLPSCGACKRLGPMWDNMVEKAKEQVEGSNFHFGEVDCSKELSSCANIRAVPTLYLYQNGEIVEEVPFGASTSEASLLDFVETHLNPDTDPDIPSDEDVLTDEDTEEVASIQPALSTSVSSLSLASTAMSKSASASEFSGSSVTKASKKLTSSPTSVASKKATLSSVSKVASTSSLPVTSVSASVDPKSAASKVQDAEFSIQTAPSFPKEKEEKENTEETEESKKSINPTGTSKALALDADIDAALTDKEGWFIQFYSSECDDCDDVSTAWYAMANRMRGKLNVAHINCAVSKRACKQYSIQYFPTFLFFKEEAFVEYVGLPNEGDLVSFAEEAANFEIREVELLDTVNAEKNGDVFFLYFYDDDSAEYLNIIRKTGIQLLGHANLYLTTSQQIAKKYRVVSFPKLIVVRDGIASYYPAKMAQDNKDYRRILGWMKNNWLPVLPELRTSNSKEIFNDESVVLFLLNPELDDFDETKRTAQKIATEFLDEEGRTYQSNWQKETDKKNSLVNEAEEKNDLEAIEAAKNFHVNGKPSPTRFAWVNGKFWAQWLRKFDIDIEATGPRVIVYNAAQDIYWDETAKGTPISIEKDTVFDIIKQVETDPDHLKFKILKKNLGVEYLESYGLNIRVLYMVLGIVTVGILVWYFSGRRARTLQRRRHSTPILPVSMRSTGNSGKFD